MQNNFPNKLPAKLRTWNFLPPVMRSLKPYDNFINMYLCFCKCCRKLKVAPMEDKLPEQTHVVVIPPSGSMFEMKEKEVDSI